MGSADIEAPAAAHLVGEYAIVEVLGHRTVVGRIAEVERFGTRFLAVEAIWQGELLPAALIGGTSIYQLTPCAAEVAFARQAKHLYDLPPSLGIIAKELPGPALTFAPAFLDEEVPTFDPDLEPEGDRYDG